MTTPPDPPIPSDVTGSGDVDPMSGRPSTVAGARVTLPSATMTVGAAMSVPPATQSYPTVMTLPPRRTLLYYVLFVAFCLLVWVFRQTLTLAFGAFAAAFVFNPGVRRVERWGIPRPFAIVLVLFTATAVVAGVLSMLAPELLRQTEALVRSVPEYSAAIQREWIPWIRVHLHMHLPPRTEDALRQLGVEASSVAPRIGSLLNGTLEYTIVIVEVMFKGLIVFALTFYLLLDFDGVMHGAFELVPHRARARVGAIGGEVDDTLRHFVTGQLVVMAMLGTLYAIGLSIAGVPAGWALGIFAGMISFVPYLGFFVALGLALVMAALQAHGPGPLLAVVAVMAAVHILDLTLITPRILGGRAKITPVVTLLSLIAGGSVFGFVGVLVAIPIASVMRVLLREAVAYYQSSTFFLTGSMTPSIQSSPSAVRSDLSGSYAPLSVPPPEPLSGVPPAIAPSMLDTPTERAKP